MKTRMQAQSLYLSKSAAAYRGNVDFEPVFEATLDTRISEEPQSLETEALRDTVKPENRRKGT